MGFNSGFKGLNMKYTTDSEQLKETGRCLAVSVFLTNCF